MLHCPNCSAPVNAEPISCPLCGYRSELAGEYLWIYLGGSAFLLLGFLLGVTGVAIEGAGPEHWSSPYRGWFPFAPWPESYHWLGVLIAGIALTVGGLGITRRWRSAWIFLVALTAYEAALALLAALGPVSRETLGARPMIFFVLATTLVLLLLRVGLAFRRTPRRDAAKLRELVSLAVEKGSRRGVERT
jgi:hypothetical protein